MSFREEAEMNVREFARGFKPTVVRHKVEWAAERDSEPLHEEQGKQILEGLCQEVIELRTNIALQLGDRDNQYRPVGELDQVLKRLKAIQRYQMKADNGSSFKAFWDEGDLIIGSLEHALRGVAGE